jgi:hypothetical protein
MGNVAEMLRFIFDWAGFIYLLHLKLPLLNILNVVCDGPGFCTGMLRKSIIKIFSENIIPSGAIPQGPGQMRRVSDSNFVEIWAGV